MEHELHFDGSVIGIAWQLKGDPGSAQTRKHADIYLGKVTREQSRYIALHVGLFWCIGTFRIRNSDTVNVMVESRSMFEHLGLGGQPADGFVEIKAGFIDQLARQRDLKMIYRSAQPDSAAELLRNAGLNGAV